MTPPPDRFRGDPGRPAATGGAVSIGRMNRIAALTLAAAVLAPVAIASAQTPASTHFLVVGDWGTGSTQQADVAKAMCASNAANPAKFVMTVGDNFYSPDGVATDGNYYQPMACLLAQGVTWRAAWGNHDLGGNSTATVLGARKRYYTYANGSTRFTMLDGNNPSSSAQRTFLERTLKAAKEPVRIVAVHQPVYTAGMHSPSYEGRRAWEPLFKKYGVSLVLSGHNHNYERIRTGGVTYITSGGGGAGLYPCVRSQPGLVMCKPVYEFLEVDSSPSGITVRAVGVKGDTIDQVTVPVRVAKVTARG